MTYLIHYHITIITHKMDHPRDQALITLIKNLNEVDISDLQRFIDLDIFTIDHLVQALRERIQSKERSNHLRNCFSQIIILAINHLTHDDIKEIFKKKYSISDKANMAIFARFFDEMKLPFKTVLQYGTTEQVKIALSSVSVREFIKSDIASDITVVQGEESSDEKDEYARSDASEIAPCVREYLDDHCQEIMALKQDKLDKLIWINDRTIPSESFIQQYIDRITDGEITSTIYGYIYTREACLDGRASDENEFYEALVNSFVQKGKIDDVFSLRIFTDCQPDMCRDEFITEKIRRIFFNTDMSVKQIIMQTLNVDKKEVRDYSIALEDRIPEFLAHFD